MVYRDSNLRMTNVNDTVKTAVNDTDSKPYRTLIIQGVTAEGRKFRPSDWAERMSGMLSTFGDDHRIHYSPNLRPVSIDGVKCIALHESIKQSNPGIYQQVMDFAKRNSLIVTEE